MTQSILSRRGAIFAGAAALVATSLGATTKSHAATNNLSIRTKKVNILSPSDGRYSSELAASFGSLAKDSVFQQLKPATVIMKNSGSAHVRAISLTWTFHTSTGEHKTTRQYYFTPRFNGTGSPKVPGKGDAKRYTGSAKLIKPNDVRLFSPFFSWSSGYANSPSRPAWRKLIEKRTENEFLLQQLKSASSVTVELGTVLFGDYTMVGEDTSGLAQRFTAQRNAQHDAGLSVLKMLKDKKSSNDIAATLLRQCKGFEKDHKGQPVDRSNAQQFIYYSERTRHAKILLMRAIKGGLPALTKTATYLKSRKITRITPLARTQEI